MATREYKLYRKMSTDEYSTLLTCGFISDDKVSPTICPKKCFSESLIAVNRLNPYYSAISNVVAEILLPANFRDRLFRDSYRLPKPIHSCADKSYDNYKAHKGMNLYYACHGNSIPLFNHEIDPNYIEVVNNSIIDVRSLDSNNYEKELLNRFFDISEMEQLLTSDVLANDEYYVQLPLDLAVLALKYKILPPGGLNKIIRNRVIGKDFDVVDAKNSGTYPVTLALKINSKAFRSKIKDSINGDTYDICSDLIHTLNTYIESIRLVRYSEDKLGYKREPSIISNGTKISDIINKNFDDTDFEHNITQLSFDDIFIILNSSKLRDYFITSINNINSSLYLNSEHHGKSHAERVCLYAYIIANYIKLPEDQIKNIIIASLLHDIGKKDGHNEDNHGYIAAKKLDELSIFTDSVESINEIKFLVEAHSINRDSLVIIDLLKKYNISNINMCLRALNVLMDADALDRTRFNEFKDSTSQLNTKYLRIPVSNKLVDISKFISKLYYNNPSKVLIKK